MNSMTEPDVPPAQPFGPLRRSARMPVLFLGHGSPMNVIEDNEYRRSWQALGLQFGVNWPRPQLILCISAHWLTRGWWLTAMEKPKTIHDFGGFPQALFDQQYPAPGAPEMAQAISAAMTSPPIGLDTHEWGLDHGSWSVLKPMFPAADMPVMQLSMDGNSLPAAHFALGQQLKALRDWGVLVVGSGNIVHNLRAIQRSATPAQAHDWAVSFDHWARDHVANGRLAALAEHRSLGALTQMAHPSDEHFLPLLYTAGAADPDEPVRFFNDNFQMSSISMRSMVWG